MGLFAVPVEIKLAPKAVLKEEGKMGAITDGPGLGGPFDSDFLQQVGVEGAFIERLSI